MDIDTDINLPTFFCGIGGCGMMPLASLLAARGVSVSGSDRAHDRGDTPDKFRWLENQGVALHRQDGSGVVAPVGRVVASAAVEDSVPDVEAARALGVERVTRAELLSRMFNAAGQSVAVGGTSGKSTVTGMIALILHRMARKPTVMNGAPMIDFVGDDAPYASALAGNPDLWVSEVDESDGSIALFRPTVAVLTNLSHDHKPMDELRALFGGFLEAADTAVVNADDAEALALAPDAALLFGLADGSRITAESVTATPLGLRFIAVDRQTDERVPVALSVPGEHNLSNALAALAGAVALGTGLSLAAGTLSGFRGIARRLETIGTADGVGVVDDFAHNPDKVAASLATLRGQDGRLLVLFQPHGYGPLTTMGEALASAFADGLGADDRLWVTEPAYFGGTTERERGGEWLAGALAERGVSATAVADRAAARAPLLAEAREGDRIVVMGARDDGLAAFARQLLSDLTERSDASQPAI